MAKLHAKANEAIELFRAGQWSAPIAPADPTGVLPGIINNSTIIPNAIFPVAPANCALSGSFSVLVTPLSSKADQTTQKNVDTMVNTYLQALETELDQLAKQPRATPWRAGSITQLPSSSNPNTDRDVFMPPQHSLLPGTPPVLSETQSIPTFDPVSWSNFVAQFGAAYTS